MTENRLDPFSIGDHASDHELNALLDEHIVPTGNSVPEQRLSPIFQHVLDGHVTILPVPRSQNYFMD